MHVFKCFVVLSHGSIVQGESSHIMLGKIALRQGLCDFPATVCSKIETDHHILIQNGSKWFIIGVGENSGLNKFVCNVLCIAVLYCLHRIVSKLSFSIDQRIIRKLYTLPTVITVHGIVTTTDGS